MNKETLNEAPSNNSEFYKTFLINKIIEAPRGGNSGMEVSKFLVLSLESVIRGEYFFVTGADFLYYFNVCDIDNNKQTIIIFNEMQLGWFIDGYYLSGFSILSDEKST